MTRARRSSSHRPIGPIPGLALAALALVAACGGGPGVTSDGGTGLDASTRCKPGQLRSCACPEGGKGVQGCDAGTFGACTGCLSADGGAAACPGCSGCCDRGTCVPLASQDQARCGRRTASCGPCAAGEACIDGACVTATTSCDVTSCAGGCCMGPQCIPFAKQSGRVCGSGAVLCTPCMGTASCSDGRCVNNLIVDSTVYHLTVKRLVLTPDNMGESWDGTTLTPGAPDPYLRVTTGSGLAGESTGCDDAQVCAPPSDVVLAGGLPLDLTGAELRAGVTLTILDRDAIYDDVAGVTGFQATSLEASYAVPAFGQVAELDLGLTPIE